MTLSSPHGLAQSSLAGFSNAETAKAAIMKQQNAANRRWTKKFVQESPDHKDEAVPDDLSVVLEFVQMLTGGDNVDEASRFTTDHGLARCKWSAHRRRIPACSCAPATTRNANDI